MGSVIYNSRASIEDLLRQGFLMPIQFAAVGTNGGVVAGIPSHDSLASTITPLPSNRRKKGQNRPESASESRLKLLLPSRIRERTMISSHFSIACTTWAIHCALRAMYGSH